MRGWRCHHSAAPSTMHALRLVLGHCTVRRTATFLGCLLVTIPPYLLVSVPQGFLVNASYSKSFSNRRTNTEQENFLGAFLLPHIDGHATFWVPDNTSSISSIQYVQRSCY